MRPAGEAPHLLLLALLLLPLASSTRFVLKNPDQSALSSVCHLTRNPSFCQHTAKHFLFPANLTVIPVPPITTHSVLSMHIDEAKRMTRNVVQAVTRMCDDPGKLNHVVVQALNNCLSDDYPTATDALEAASQRLRQSDVPALRIELSAVLTGFSSCDDEFANIPGSPVPDRNRKLEMVTKVMLDLASFLK